MAALVTFIKAGASDFRFDRCAVGGYVVVLIDRSTTMGKVLVFVVLMVVALAAPAQPVVKCTQADGSVAYQTGGCSAGAAQETLNIDATPLPPQPPVRHMVQAFDPATGIPTEMWLDGPAAPTSGPTYTTREMKQVFDPVTGIPHEMWVDVTKPVPMAPAPRQYQPYSTRGYEPTPPRPAPRSRSRYNEGDNSVYEKAKCRVSHASGC